MDPLPDESRLIRTIRDLANLAANAADWVDGPPLLVADRVAELLVKTLRLDFAYLRLQLGPKDGHELEVAATINGPTTEAQTRAIGKALAPWLDRPESNEIRSVTNPLGSGMVPVVVVPIGRIGEAGVIVAGSLQASFPGAEDRLLLNVVANQAAVSLQFRKAEQARLQLLKERDELLARLRLQFAHMPIACIVFDPQIRIIDWNPAAEKIFGYRRDEVLGNNGDLLVPPSNRERADEINRGLSVGEADSHSTSKNVTKDGRIIVCDWTNTSLRNADGHVIAVLSMAQDISERTQNKYELERSEESLREAQHLTHIGSWSWDIASDQVLWSDEHYRIFGMRPQEMGMTYERLLTYVHPDDRAIVQNEVSQSVRDNQPFEFYFRALHRNGTVRVLHSRGQVEVDEHGKPFRMFGTAQDITERIRSDEALEQSRRRFQAIFENSLDGMLLFDDAGRYLDANPAMCQLLGFSREEFVQMMHSDVTPASDRERIPDQMAQFLSTGTLSGNNTVVCKRGDSRLVEFRAVANILPGVHLSVQRDVTDRERVAEALLQSEERFRFLAESIPHMVWAAGPGGDGNYHNTRFSDYLGVAPETLQGDGWAETLHPDDRRRVFDAWNVAWRQGTEYRIECRFRAKTGGYRWFLAHGLPQRDAGGQVVRWFGTCTDIDERKRAEEALREGEERLTRLVEVMPAAVYTCDAEGRVTFFNRRAVEIWGREPDPHEKFCGSWRLWGIDGAPMPHDQTPMANCIQNGSSVRDVTVVVERPGGDRAVVSVNIAPLVDHQGRRVGAINVFEDVTDRMRADEALRETAARLQALSRRVVEVQEEERRHLARELHDEIGQVLSTISVNLQAAKAICGAAATPRIEESIQIVDQAIQQVRNLSLDLRPSMLDDLGLIATIRWYADRQAQRAGFALHFAVESWGTFLPADLTIACFRVVQEALTNAARHAHARNVWIELRQTDEKVEVTIRDDGVGFDPETAFRRAAQGESFGLLGILERVELQGGRADIKSQTGGETSIRVTFPITGTRPTEGQFEGEGR
jgi:PAS domain S-box-containing protein